MSRVKDTADQVSHAADNIRDKAADVTQHVRDGVNEIGHKIRDAASDTYGQVRDQAVGYVDQGKQTASEWEESLEDYVQKKPLQAVLIAAGVGLLLGLIWKRR